MQFKKTKQAEPEFELTIYLKNHKRPFCEIEVPNESFLTQLNMELNNPAVTTIKFGQVVFRKDDFDYAVLKEIWRHK